MKTLIMVRHAKSDWSNLHLTDAKRELNVRGLKDAPFMGRKLLQRNLAVELLLSSTATRAAQTAQLIAAEIGYDTARIEWHDDLYHAPAHKIAEQVTSINNSIKHAMIVCHNPGITDFVNMQCGVITENVPTCGITAFEIDTDKWEEFPLASRRLLFYDYPKLDL